MGQRRSNPKISFGTLKIAQKGPAKNEIVSELAKKYSADANKIDRELTADQVRILKMAYEINAAQLSKEEVAKLPMAVLRAILYRHELPILPDGKKEALVEEVFKLNVEGYAAARAREEAEHARRNQIPMAPLLDIAAKYMTPHERVVITLMTGNTKEFREANAQLVPNEVIYYDKATRKPKKTLAVSPSMDMTEMYQMLYAEDAWVLRGPLIEVSKNVDTMTHVYFHRDYPFIVVRLRNNPYITLYYYKPGFSGFQNVRRILVEAQIYRDPPLTAEAFKNELVLLGYGLNWLKKWTNMNAYSESQAMMHRTAFTAIMSEDNTSFRVRNAMEPSERVMFEKELDKVWQAWYNNMKKLFTGSMPHVTGKPRKPRVPASAAPPPGATSTSGL